MKIAYSEKIIPTEIGVSIGGYGPYDITVEKLDELYMTMLVMDDGNKKIILISYDLLGIDANWLNDIRSGVAAVFGGSPADCMISCSHTHTGPQTREYCGLPDVLNVEYLNTVKKLSIDTAKEIAAKEFIETEIYFYSQNCDKNRNRRYIGPENRCSFLPFRRDMEPMSNGVCDKEMGGLCFINKATQQPEYIIGNFAAHPLAGHCPGIGGHRISADYPGIFRNYIKSETGAGCMFISGAAGDVVPHGHETGVEAIRQVGTAIACAAIEGILIATRDAESFKLKNETLQSTSEFVTCRTRPHKNKQIPSFYPAKDKIELELQVVSIGDVCFIGVPGELVVELGLEMKWHSPFRKTFIAYCSTGYVSYLCHGNALVSGGYEGGAQLLDSHGGLKLVNTAVEGAYKVYEKTFPDQSGWPENHHPPLVALKNI